MEDRLIPITKKAALLGYEQHFFLGGGGEKKTRLNLLVRGAWTLNCTGIYRKLKFQIELR